MTESTLIPKEDCVVGGIYEVNSRNLSVAIFTGNAFRGARWKFNSVYLFDEYHHDDGPPFGTVRPIRRLACEMEPVEYELNEFEPWAGVVDPLPLEHLTKESTEEERRYYRTILALLDAAGQGLSQADALEHELAGAHIDVLRQPNGRLQALVDTSAKDALTLRRSNWASERHKQLREAGSEEGREKWREQFNQAWAESKEQDLPDPYEHEFTFEAGSPWRRGQDDAGDPALTSWRCSCGASSNTRVFESEQAARENAQQHAVIPVAKRIIAHWELHGSIEAGWEYMEILKGILS